MDKAIEEMAREAGDSFDVEHINLAEFSRRTGLSRSKARRLKANGFRALPHGRCGMRAEMTVIAGFTGVVDALLKDGVTSTELTPYARNPANLMSRGPGLGCGGLICSYDFARRIPLGRLDRC